jgi:hypothetical protein
MKDLDLQELADLWQEPDAAGAEDVQALARRARRDAFVMSWVDTAWGVIIVGSLVVGAFMKPSVPVAIGALLTIFMTLWINWKRRSLRQMTRTLGTGDRGDFLDASVRLAKAAYRRTTFGLVAFPPAILAALVYRVTTRGEMLHPLDALGAWVTSPRGMIALLLLGGLVVWMLRSLRRHKEELRRLEEVRAAYAQEEARDQEDGA